MEQEQEASWLEQILEIEEKSPNGTRAGSKLVGANSRNRGKIPNGTRVGNKSVGANSPNRGKIPN